MTQALANPVFWYVIDRTRAGFYLATALAVTGTSVLVMFVRDIVPLRLPTMAPAAPGTPPFLGLITYESIGLVTWITSVLFISCLCFGNIGRLLAGGCMKRAKMM